MSHPKTCADAAVQQLCSAGLDTCFANPGTTEMFLVSALESNKASIRSILCLHEAVCTGACDGFARLADRPAVSLLHLGPGLGNGLCNLHNAHRALSPVLVLVGEHATWHSSADPPLAQNIQQLAGTVSGHVLTVTAADTVCDTMQQALDALAKPTAPASSSSSSSSNSSSSEAGLASVHTSTESAASPAAAAATHLAVSSSCPSSRVVTVVFPHDISWQTAHGAPLTAPATPLTAASASQASGGGSSQPGQQQQQRSSHAGLQGLSVHSSPAVQSFLKDCAAALQAAPRGKAALLLGGAALLHTGNSCGGIVLVGICTHDCQLECL
jgi:acetolactate synthase-1/2/3 large subunit